MCQLIDHWAEGGNDVHLLDSKNNRCFTVTAAEAREAEATKATTVAMAPTAVAKAPTAVAKAPAAAKAPTAVA